VTVVLGVCVVFSILGFLFATYALIEIKAMQRSTHKIQFFNPSSGEFTPLTDDQKKELSKDVFDNI